MPQQLPFAQCRVHCHGDVAGLGQGLYLLRVVTAAVGAAKEVDVKALELPRVHQPQELRLTLAPPVAPDIDKVLHLGLRGTEAVHLREGGTGQRLDKGAVVDGVVEWEHSVQPLYLPDGHVDSEGVGPDEA